MPSHMTLSRLGRACATAAALLAVVSPVALADGPEGVEAPGVEVGQTKPTGAAPCAERVFATVFAPWRDKRLYTLSPGGDFETLAEGWTLEGATLAADSSPFLLGEALGTSSLELSAGASAVSPPICVQRGFQSFRFVARSVGEERAVVKVQVLYAKGREKATARLKPAAEWTPTRKLSLAQGRFKVRKGRSAEVRLRFAVTDGTARVDDVYVDPRMWR